MCSIMHINGIFPTKCGYIPSLMEYFRLVMDFAEGVEYRYLLQIIPFGIILFGINSKRDKLERVGRKFSRYLRQECTETA